MNFHAITSTSNFASSVTCWFSFQIHRTKAILSRNLLPHGDASCDLIDGMWIFVNTTPFDVVDELHVNFGEYILQNMHDFQYTKDFETVSY